MSENIALDLQMNLIKDSGYRAFEFQHLLQQSIKDQVAISIDPYQKVMDDLVKSAFGMYSSMKEKKNV